MIPNSANPICKRKQLLLPAGKHIVVQRRVNRNLAPISPTCIQSISAPGNISSMEPISFENRFNIRPDVERKIWKKIIGSSARRTSEVIGRSIDRPTGRICIEEVHRSSGDSFEHGIVQSHRYIHTHFDKRERTDQRDGYHAERNYGENVDAPLARHILHDRFLRFRTILIRLICVVHARIKCVRVF